MSITDGQPISENENTHERFSEDLASLKGSFSQLRQDVSRLLDNTMGTGRSGVGVLRDKASDAMGNIKDRLGDLKDTSAESMEKFGEKIAERPLLSAAIAVGIGFILAKLLTSKR